MDWLQVTEASNGMNEAGSTFVVSLDSKSGWLIAADPANRGREERWWSGPVTEAVPTRVPWMMQGALPGYHGVAWYWRDVVIPRNPHHDGRYLLRFWMVDYVCEVWVNETSVGTHEDGEEMFVLDATDAVRPGSSNIISLRVLNPTHERIDDIILAETPHRNKVSPESAGASYNFGGIVDSVELLLTPALRVEYLFVRTEAHTGIVRVQATVRNGGTEECRARVALSLAPATTGETFAATTLDRHFAPGATTVEASLIVKQPRRWELNDPYLYRLSVRAQAEGSLSFDEQSTRFGFREFQFERGAFRLNGRRIYLRSSHTGADSPIGICVPYDPDWLRRDLLNVKAMGFNMIRFISGIGRRIQLELADEIGLMVYEECFAGWCLGDSPKMGERFDRSLSAMIRRDRNHPSVVIWGLLNETGDGPVFRHAADALPVVHALDDTRVVILGSGRFDAPGVQQNGLEYWMREHGMLDLFGSQAYVIRNPKPYAICYVTLWASGGLAFRPGTDGDYAVIRWRCPESGVHAVSANFQGISVDATVDVHVLHNGAPLFRSHINLCGCGNECSYSDTVKLTAGDTIDFVVGWGDGNAWPDDTGIRATIHSPSGANHDPAKDFSPKANPNGQWSYGFLRPGEAPDASTFQLFTAGGVMDLDVIGGICNPGSKDWEDLVADTHYYLRNPHTRLLVSRLRTFGGNDKPVFFSEYGVGSANDLVRLIRHFEQRGKAGISEAMFYRSLFDQFMADWERWRMNEAFASPEDYFRQCVAKMAARRREGINALRSNPWIIGYSLTGTNDQGLTGEGLTTAFRELKPGTMDALFESLAPLRLCLFTEPVSVYRGATVRLEAILANEDVLSLGTYPVRIQLLGPNNTTMLDRVVTISVPAVLDDSESPFALPVFNQDVVVDGEPGRYRFLAALQKGGAATGGEAEFFVTDPCDMPKVTPSVSLWGEDAYLERWLGDRGIKVATYIPGDHRVRQVILVSYQPPAGSGSAWQDLVRCIADGSVAIFLSTDVFGRGDALDLSPVSLNGKLAFQIEYRFPNVYLKDEWAKRHPIFDGLQSGGLMDYGFYREIIPDGMLAGLDTPLEAVAGSIRTSAGYVSGLLTSVHALGYGKLILNTLRIRENLGVDPVAERLLRNMLNYAESILKART